VTWWLIVLILVIALPGVVWLLNRPLRHRNVRMKDLERRFFTSWIADLDTGTIITLREDTSRQCIHFVLNKSESGSELRLDLPDSERSRERLPAVLEALDDAGVESGAGDRRVDDGERLHVITLRGDEEALTALGARAAVATLTALGASESSTLTVWAEGSIDPRALERGWERLLDHRSPLVRAWARRRLDRARRK
jgi:hypothetical protein